MPEGCDPTCLMLNYQLQVEPFEYVLREDKKIKGFDSKETFKEATKDRECISSAPNIRNSYMGNWLKTHFPDKCKYEI